MKVKSKEVNIRDLAIDLLERIEFQGTYSNLAIDEALRQNDIGAADRNLLTELVYGVTQRRLTLDYYIDSFLRNKSLESWVRQNLRIALYQSVYLDRIPAHAIVNEAVKIAKKKGHRGISNLVNGVLRNIQRQGLPSLELINDPIERLSIAYSMPVWFVKISLERLGESETKKLLQSLNERPRLSVRVNLSKMSREEVVVELEKEGIIAQASEYSPYGILIEKGHPQYSALFEEGILTIQDESSMLVAPALDVEANHQVLDACSAPGGKATHIASEFLKSSENGKIMALDLYPNKIKKINENAERQGVADRLEPMQLDALKTPEKFGEKQFDRVLVDAPCSGFGLMRRKPEIRYNKSLKDLKDLADVQYKILSAAAQTVKSNGQMIYSTCTFTEEENQQVIEKFLRENPDFKPLPLTQITEKIELNENKNTVTIYPHEYGMDGFFISKFIRC